MQLQNSFTVPVPADEAWRALLDIEHVSQCMPGTTVQEYDGDTVKGSMKVRVGPTTVTYRGTATFLEKDGAAHRMVLSARGDELRGPGTASATVTAVLTGGDGGTTVSVTTDLTVTGRPARFGRCMNDVSDGLVGRFADCLAQRLSATEPSAPAQPAAGTADIAPTGRAEPVGLLRTAGGPVGRRVAGAAAVTVLAVLGALLARRCCRCGGACRTCHTR
ncbi:SRPBCC family protein [Streptomyces sp. NPDC048295]|uniref:SRPBCC family protein n=1 Tax=Streptomyces sp. NPDC048295 TaxID=3154617 RepID=UPI003420B474